MPPPVGEKWSVGDSIVLLASTLPQPESAWEELLAMLGERGFLRSISRVHGDIIGFLRTLCEASGTGCRVVMESDHLTANVGAIVTCRGHAHFALALVVERTKRFEAYAVGRVVEQGVMIRVDGVSR